MVQYGISVGFDFNLLYQIWEVDFDSLRGDGISTTLLRVCYALAFISRFLSLTAYLLGRVQGSPWLLKSDGKASRRVLAAFFSSVARDVKLSPREIALLIFLGLKSPVCTLTLVGLGMSFAEDLPLIVVGVFQRYVASTVGPTEDLEVGTTFRDPKDARSLSRTWTPSRSLWTPIRVR